MDEEEDSFEFFVACSLGGMSFFSVDKNKILRAPKPKQKFVS
jgi:hypothetical protein